MSNINNKLDFEIEKLREELKQETAKKDAAEKSARDSEWNLGELQNKLMGEFNDKTSNNNWKLKYEKQHEKNTYLEHELSLMKEKLEALSKTIAESPTSKKSNQPDLDLRLLLRQLEHEKCVLEGKVKDAEWRLDSESKELFNLNEKKREYMLKLNQSLQRSPPFLNKKKLAYQGIPDNQRIIDPRKGPIKKNACVNLPKITTEEVNAVLNANKKHKIKKNNKEKQPDKSIVTDLNVAKELDINNNHLDITDMNNNDIPPDTVVTTDKNITEVEGEDTKQHVHHQDNTKNKDVLPEPLVPL